MEFEFKLNENKDHVMNIRKGLEKKNGHCPCQLEVSPKTICPCLEFVETGHCHCKLYIKVEK